MHRASIHPINSALTRLMSVRDVALNPFLATRYCRWICDHNSSFASGALLSLTPRTLPPRQNPNPSPKPETQTLVPSRYTNPYCYLVVLSNSPCSNGFRRELLFVSEAPAVAQGPLPRSRSRSVNSRHSGPGSRRTAHPQEVGLLGIFGRAEGIREGFRIWGLGLR